MKLLIDFTDRRKESVIYKITCLVTGKFYIGRAVNFRKRMFRHLGLLRKNNHDSPHFQNAWNKYEEKDFVVEIIEYCEPHLLKIREQHYLDTLRPWDENIGFNISKYSENYKNQLGRPASEARKNAISKAHIGKKRNYLNVSHEEFIKEREIYKNFWLRSPNNELVFVESVYDFLKIHPYITRATLMQVVKKTKNVIKGWTLAETPVEFLRLVDPKGNIKIISEYLLRDLKKEYKIKPSYLKGVWRGEKIHEKGWTCHGKNNLRYVFKHPLSQKEEIVGIGTVASFVKKYNLCRSGIDGIIKREYGHKTCKGWYLDRIIDPLNEFPELVESFKPWIKS